MFRYFEINGNGHNIRSKLYYRDLHTISRVVIFCHGFGGHKDNGAAEKFAERVLTKYKNTAVVTFNLPCHGDDVKKKLSLTDCMTYLELVVEHVRQKYQTEQLYCYATSFGAYLTLKYIHQRTNPFRKIALRGPAVNIYEALTRNIMTPENMALLQKGRDTLVGFDRKVPVGMPFLKELQDNDIQTWDFLDDAEDILILHGTADEIIPFDVVNAFADNNLIELIPVDGADHRFRDMRKMEEAIKHILQFYGF